MAESAPQRYAVVTGSNKGIGFEIVKQLAEAGIKVVLTARDEKRGLQALETLKASGLSHSVVFHQLDVADAASVAALADFVKSQFGKLDILALSEDEKKKAVTETYELAEECLKINYYGTKITTESFLALLKLSDSPRIVNVSSILGKLERIQNEWAEKVFSDADNLTEEKVDEVLKKFLQDFKEGGPKRRGAYVISKAAVNAYTRIAAKNFPTVSINSVCPGYVITDITANTGILTAEEGAASVVKLALLPNGSPSGRFYSRTAVSFKICINVRYAVVTGSNKGIGFEIVRQLAEAGIKVVLTARDEKRGLQALETLKASGLSHSVVFHQLDVADASSVASLAHFVKSQFGKLDILALSAENRKKALIQTHELAKECLQTNCYGSKITSESLLPLLQLSDSPRIVNVSSTLGQLESIPYGWAKSIFSDADNLTEEKVDKVLKKFLNDFKEGSLDGDNGWPKTLSAYIISKAAINAYTRIVAKNFPFVSINSVCPGYVVTDITDNTGFLTVEEGAASVVRLALIPNDSPSGFFFYRNEVSSF
ncbi:hypothetical protein RYX36_023722 [Vicia faba]